MCFAFTDAFEKRTDLSKVTQSVEPCLSYTDTLLVNEDIAAPVTPSKRRASALLEREPVKAAKLSSVEDKDATDASPTRDLSSLVPSNKQVVDRAKLANYTARHNKLQIDFEKAQAEMSGLQKQCDDLEADRDEYRLKSVHLENEVAELNEDSQGAKGKKKGSGHTMSKRLENEIKENYEKKRARDQAKHDQQLQQAKVKHQRQQEAKDEKYENKLEDLEEKHAKERTQSAEKYRNLRDLCQKKLDERDAKHKKTLDDQQKRHQNDQKTKDDARDKKISELKSKDQKREEEWRNFKAEHKKLQKDLREDCQEEVKSLKPEHSTAVKDRDSTIKEREHEIVKLRASIDDLKHAKLVVERERESIRALDEEKGRGILRLKEVKNGMAAVILSRNEEIEAYKKRLEYEGQRWQIQYNEKVDLEHRLVHQQRSAYTLKQGHTRKDKRMEDLEGELTATKGELEAARAEVDSLTSSDGMGWTNGIFPDAATGAETGPSNSTSLQRSSEGGMLSRSAEDEHLSAADTSTASVDEDAMLPANVLGSFGEIFSGSYSPM